ncbi:MAG: cbb3-type cytochrome c oxidase subunit I [Bacteroidota bacterium]
MVYSSLIIIVMVLLIGMAISVFILMWSDKRGQYRNVKAGAYVIFDEDEPVGQPQDQTFAKVPPPGGDGGGVPRRSAFGPSTYPEPPPGWRSDVDRSVKWPVLAYVGSAVFWLLVGSIFALLASFKFNFPDWLVEDAWLTFGRLRPAHLQTVIFGWLSMVGIGVGTWLWCRLLKTPLRNGGLMLVGCVLWNVGMVIGTIGLLAGFARSIEWVEFPVVAYLIIVAGFLLNNVALFRTLAHRRVQHLYVSIWYIGASLLWTPILLVTFLLPVYSGVPHATANWWFAHNILGLWLTPAALAAAYYFIPKVTGRPVYSYHLSIIGFWTLALFYNWAGAHHLVGGPPPQWVVTTGIVFSVMMIIPVVVVALNHHMTIVGRFRRVMASPTLRFVVFGAMSYTSVSIQGSLQSLRGWQEVTHFTHYTIAHSHLGVYAFATMIMFGALYYILPRLTGWEWRSSKLIAAHFWLVGMGIGAYVVALTVGGVIQGLAMLNPNVPFLAVVESTKLWLLIRSVSGTLMTIGHIIFAYLVFENIRKGGPQRDAPTLFPLARRQPAAASSK